MVPISVGATCRKNTKVTAKGHINELRMQKTQKADLENGGIFTVIVRGTHIIHKIK
jgi:hypothetical protein